MAQIYIRTPYAASGDQIIIPNDPQGDGSASFSQGYTPNYELDPATSPGAQEISRGEFNYLLYAVTLGLQQYQQFGVPDFITSVDNNGSAFPYAKFAKVRYNIATFPASDVRVFESLVDNNTALPTDPTKWSDTSANSSGAPVGAVVGYAAPLNTIDAGWLPCMGQAVSRTTYAALFAKIGTLYGVGDGSTTFNLPDDRGRAEIGLDSNAYGTAFADRVTNAGSSVDARTLGAVGGSQLMHQHTHTTTQVAHSHAVRGYAGVNADSAGLNSAVGGSAGSRTSAESIDIIINSAGAGNSQNMIPVIVRVKIIKT